MITSHQGEGLEGCPFCGGSAELIEDGDPKYPFAVVSRHDDECFLAYSNVNRHRAYETAEQAIATWHRRAPGEDAGK